MPLVVYLCVYFVPNTAFSHGVVHNVIEGGVGIHAMYNDGSPLSYSDVKVYAPGNEQAFQEGMTDANGRFLIFPAEAGTWKITVNDGMGHGLVEEIEVEAGMIVKNEHVSHSDFPTYQRALVGVGIIFGLSGFYFWIVAKPRFHD